MNLQGCGGKSSFKVRSAFQCVYMFRKKMFWTTQYVSLHYSVTLEGKILSKNGFDSKTPVPQPLKKEDRETNKFY